MTTWPSAPTRPRDAGALRGLCGGAVYLPGDTSYDEARMPWNLQADAHPAAVAYPAFPDEVAALVRAAAAAGLKVAPQGTGHGAPPFAGGLSEAVLLRTSAMTEIRIDPERRSARVGAGVLWGDVTRRAGAVDLACRHMSSSSVGVIGSSLGGGINWYGRWSGLQCSALTAVEVVLADGTFVRATQDTDRDVLWAARGGGGGFGVVTAVEFDLLPVATPYAGMMVWDWADAERVLRVWADWAVDAPDAVTTVARLFQAPDAPFLPDGIRNRQVLVIDGAVVGDPIRAARIMAPLRALRPEIDTFGVVPAATLSDMHLEPTTPTAVHASSAMLKQLPDRAVEAIVATAGPGSDSRLLFTEIRQLGGAMSRPSPRSGALDRMVGDFLVLNVGVDEDPAGWTGLREDADRVLSAVEPWAADGLYLSMVDDDADEQRGWTRAAWHRLSAIRAAADPHGLFVTRGADAS